MTGIRGVSAGALLLLVVGCSRADALPTREQPAATGAAVPAGGLQLTKPGTTTPAVAVVDYLVVEVQGLTCGGCKWEIEDKFGKIAGVRSVNVNIAGECAAIAYDGKTVARRALFKAFDELAYEVREVGDERLTSTPSGEVQCIARP